MNNDDARALLSDLWYEGVKAVRGDTCTTVALDTHDVPCPDAIIAVGKAAASMASAAYARFGADIPGLVVTKYGHSEGTNLPPNAQIIESAHPVPDANSLNAGERLIAFVSTLPKDSHLLVLVSGGASSLAEVPAPGLTLADAIVQNHKLLAAGLDIHEMNRRRKETSQIKGGQLLARFPGARTTVLAMSDVEGDNLSVIGSGIGALPDNTAFQGTAHIIASNAIARAAVANAAITRGLPIRVNDETLYCDVGKAAPMIGATLRNGDPGLYIWGGEPTVHLPDNPGRGGRNQALALLVAQQIARHPGITALIAGTDGTDGPTQDAGGFADGTIWGDGAEDALRKADSGSYLGEKKALFTSGPTGTNVMDLALALKT
ncbi:MAG: DUF4147 domain-containing protein [Rhodobacteraceae bacterium]|nr:DUF4147 domain-containing protein [Paracoccaceae bacterium]